VEVLVNDNARVAAGGPLARLDSRDLEVKKRQIAADAQRAEAELRRAGSEIDRAEAALAQENAQLRKVTRDFQRAAQLFQSSSGAISRQEFDEAQAAHESRQAAVKAAEAALASAQALRTAGAAQRAAAEAALADIDLQLTYTVISAPAGGRIGRKNVEVGHRIQPGQALFALVGNDVWLVANFKETQLARMRTGQRAEIRLDAVDRVFEGRVESFSPASGAQFALLPPDNAIGNFTRIVQRIPVKITFAADALRGLENRIVPGMSATVEVKIRD
jgi:membrane fusion protein (multidrug efflux system)